jgi:CrcB protein
MSYLLIFFGGDAGSLCRYLMSRMLFNAAGDFPIGTMAVSLSGSFVIGLLARALTGDSARLQCITGFLGGFTTFSAFTHKTCALWRNGLPFHAVSYVALSNAGGVLAAWLGWRLLPSAT